jgi:hypothetical protein
MLAAPTNMQRLRRIIAKGRVANLDWCSERNGEAARGRVAEGTVLHVDRAVEDLYVACVSALYLDIRQSHSRISR